jgi:hypothetical protein
VSLSNKEFDLLNWWKVNSHRFPVVSRMAKKIPNYTGNICVSGVYF